MVNNNFWFLHHDNTPAHISPAHGHFVAIPPKIRRLSSSNHNTWLAGYCVLTIIDFILLSQNLILCLLRLILSFLALT